MIFYLLFVDKVRAIHDIWFLGDGFLKEIFSIYDNIKKEEIPPYIMDYFNISAFYQKITSGVRHLIARIINALTEALNTEKKLPKYLVVIIDKDIIDGVDVFEHGANKVVQDLVEWVTRQINILIRRRRLEMVDRKPRSMLPGTPQIIFVRMLHCQKPNKPGSKLEKTFALRAKINDALNEAARKLEQFILTIKPCNTMDHFDQWGNLSPKGKYDYFYEIDDLLERFDKGKVKLLPAL